MPDIIIEYCAVFPRIKYYIVQNTTYINYIGHYSEDEIKESSGRLRDNVRMD